MTIKSYPKVGQFYPPWSLTPNGLISLITLLGPSSLALWLVIVHGRPSMSELGIVAVVTGLLGLVCRRMLFYLAGLYVARVSVPPCRHSTTSNKGQYYFDRGRSVFGWIGFITYHFGCEHGEQYIRWGRLFMVVNDNDQCMPYKILTADGRWVDDPFVARASDE